MDLMSSNEEYVKWNEVEDSLLHYKPNKDNFYDFLQWLNYIIFGIIYPNDLKVQLILKRLSDTIFVCKCAISLQIKCSIT